MRAYDNDKITVTFDPTRCIHSGVCVKNLPEVFNLTKRPWINVDGADIDKIKAAIDTCPSGALQYHNPGEVQDPRCVTVVKVVEAGPLIVQDMVEVITEEGITEIHPDGCTLCRCGKSHKKPFCDGSHMRHE